MTGLLIKNFDVLGQLFTDCLNAKNNPKYSNIKLQETLRKTTLLFVLLKKSNRSLQHRVHHAEENLASEKCLIDSKRLILQSLLYEANQLKHEIELCYQFKGQSKDNDDIYEEQRMANENRHKIELLHKRRFEHLERELNIRMELASEYNKLVSTKMMLSQDVRDLKQLLRNTSSCQNIFQAAKPIKDSLQLPLEIILRDFDNKRQLLPRSLYLVYVNLKFVQMDMDYFKVKIAGNEDDVQIYTNLKNQMNIRDMNKEQFLKPYPLHLQITINIQEFERDILTIDIFNIPLLDLVTAHYNVHVISNFGIITECTIMENILNFICENDCGECMPHAEVESKLEKRNLCEADCLKYLKENNYGKPYRWLQQMCGGPSALLNAKCDKLKSFSTNIIKRLKQNWQIRLRLLDQIAAFKKQNLDIYMDDNEQKYKMKCSLVQWSSMTWEEYALNPGTLHYRKAQLVDEDCYTFHAILISNSAKMDCIICISNKYIYNAPIWMITVHWNGEYYNALNNASIKIMEYSTNCLRTNNFNKFHLLAAQLLRTMYSFDKFLDTENRYNYQLPECSNKDQQYDMKTCSKYNTIVTTSNTQQMTKQISPF